MTAPIPEVGAKNQGGVERRRFLRKPKSMSSYIAYGPENRIVACIIRELSDGGARISVSGPEIVPDWLTLLEPISLVAYVSNVRWRCGALLGLAFRQKTSLANDEIDRLYLLRQEALRLINQSEQEMGVPKWSEADIEVVRGNGASLATVKPFLLVVTDRDTNEITIEGPMTDDTPWIEAVRAAHNAGRKVSCHTPGPGTIEEVAQRVSKQLELKVAPPGSIVRPEED